MVEPGERQVIDVTAQTSGPSAGCLTTSAPHPVPPGGRDSGFIWLGNGPG